MKSTLKVYQDEYLWKYIESFNICQTCNIEYEPSNSIVGECRNCVVNAWNAMGYYL
jgi:hypothetical protein